MPPITSLPANPSPTRRENPLDLYGKWLLAHPLWMLVPGATTLLVHIGLLAFLLSHHLLNAWLATFLFFGLLGSCLQITSGLLALAKPPAHRSLIASR